MRRLPIVLTLMALLPLHTKAAPGTDPFEQNHRLGRGINIPGVFDRDGKTVPDPPMKPEYFKKIGDAGFKNVRLVIRWSSYAQQEAPYSIDPVFFKRVDCRRLGARGGGAPEHPRPVFLKGGGWGGGAAPPKKPGGGLVFPLLPPH